MEEHVLETPIKEKDVRKLQAGDTIYLSGRMITARDDAHHKALELFKKGEQLPVDFEGMVIYHCGPIMRQVQGKWEVVAAGPTTSTRMDLF
ncbi:MAG: fumarate hydratase C-terminal domain-containing protein, partial [Candidatus Heimdallarchaeota archaeon]